MRLHLPAFVTAAALLALAAAPAQAKLPPLNDEAKAKAAEAAARTAWSDKVGGYKLCLVVDKIAARYQATAATKAAAATTAAPVATPPCADPGPFVMVETPKPLEASGAHSPAATAVGAPSSNATEAEIKGGLKK